MTLRNFTLRRLLILAFGCMTAIVLIVSTMAILSVNEGESRFAEYVGGAVKMERLASEVLSAASGRAIAARNLVLVTDDTERMKEHGAVLREHDHMGKALAELRKAVVSAPYAKAADRKLLEQIEAVESQYGPVALAITKLAIEGQRDPAVAKMNSECRPLLQALERAVAEMIAEQKRQAVRAEGMAEEAAHSETYKLLASCAAAAIAAVGLAVHVLGSVTRPLREAVRVAEAVADGDLTTTISTERKDELGQLVRAMQRMSANLSEMVDGVRMAADGVRTSSTEIATGNQHLSQRTEQQATALQQTAASMQQMTSSVQHSAESARQANQIAATAMGAAREGGDVVGRVVSTMEGISESSAKIADIIGTIDSIAFQTNILALNAAVEAARAGEQGRGFAVVASEVRSLAARSAEASKEVRSLIQASLERVDAGSRLVNEAGSAMDNIVTQVTRVADLLAEVDSASQQQSTGIVQVNQAVTSIDEGTQQNAALVEESAAAAESLRQQADALATTISRFRTAHAAMG